MPGPRAPSLSPLAQQPAPRKTSGVERTLNCLEARRGQGLWLARNSCVFHRRGWLEMPLAALVLGQNDWSDVVPSAVEAHVPRHTCVFIGFVHNIMNPVPVGPRLL